MKFGHALLSNGLFPWGWSGRSVKETTHLHLVPRSNEWNCTSTHLYAFMVWCLVKALGWLHLLPLPYQLYFPSRTETTATQIGYIWCLQITNYKWMVPPVWY